MLSVSSHAAFLGTSSFFHLNGPLWPFFFFYLLCRQTPERGFSLKWLKSISIAVEVLWW